MIASPILAVVMTVLPSDRMAMADRLFDRGNYAEAKGEYEALCGVQGVAPDELLYRLAETERALGNVAVARQRYWNLISKYPGSRHAERSQLMRALLGTDEQKKQELSDFVKEGARPEVRVPALYHLGRIESDVAKLDLCRSLDPTGRYAQPAAFVAAKVLSESSDPARRREAVGRFLDLSRTTKDAAQAHESLYLAVRCSYGNQAFGETADLATRYLGAHPQGAYASNVRIMAAWSNYLAGKWSACQALCGEGENDDLAYLRGACALSLGDSARALELFRKYLADYPQGRYRATVELPLARLEFAAAEKSGDASKTLEAANRSAQLSKSAADRLRYAWALENAGDLDRAMVEYEAVVNLHPKTSDAAEALFRRAMISARKTLWEACELDLRRALDGGLNPTRRAEALYWRGIAMHNLPHKDHEVESVALLREALGAGLPIEASREARLLIADYDFKQASAAEAKGAVTEANEAYVRVKQAYATLVREGAYVRMNADRIRKVGRFLLEPRGGSVCAEEAEQCGKALAERNDSPAWRQAGLALQGAAEESRGLTAAAIAAYREAQKMPLRTEDMPEVLLNLGILEYRQGEREAAAATLGQAVALTAADPARRMKVYLWLARVSEALGQRQDARRYATFVTTLFDATDEATRRTQGEAEELLKTFVEGEK